VWEELSDGSEKRARLRMIPPQAEVADARAVPADVRRARWCAAFLVCWLARSGSARRRAGGLRGVCACKSELMLPHDDILPAEIEGEKKVQEELR